MLHDERVVLSELRDFVLADEVNPAVADIGNRKLIAFHHHGYDRRTHSGNAGVSRSGIMNCLVRQLDGSGKIGGSLGDPLKSGNSVGGGIGALAVVAENRVHSDLAGQLPGLLSTHAVGNDKDAVAQVVSKIIFIVLANQADVGLAGGLNHVAHAGQEIVTYRLSQRKP